VIGRTIERPAVFGALGNFVLDTSHAQIENKHPGTLILRCIIAARRSGAADAAVLDIATEA
jgi:hypothetical protein